MSGRGVAETYNFNYDLATPPAPSEVGLDMFQKFMNDPSRTSRASWPRPRPRSRQLSQTSRSASRGVVTSRGRS